MRPLKLVDGRRRPPITEVWTATRNAAGVWVILDQNGEEPLRAVDPVRRLEAVHLAAKAPELRAALAELTKYLRMRDDGYGFAEKLSMFAISVLFECKPLYSEVMRAAESGAQTEIDLEAA